ncbi:MAG: CoA transferase [Chloroflexi bacterium]|nr:CoA transferase [Chloroflexota bacterium]
MPLPLEGIRIIDFSQAAQGPYASQMLSDAGADVIKVEHPVGGDIVRVSGYTFHGGDSVYLLAMNRNKRSICVDIKQPEGRELILRLAERSDVLLQNFRPGVMERLGLGYADVAARNPRIIFMSASCYGDTGPWRDLGGGDIMVQGAGGLMSITGPLGGEPVAVGCHAVDLFGSLLVLYGITMGLLVRERLGIGQEIKSNLLNASIAMQSFEATAYHINQRVPPRAGRSHMEFFPFGAYPTRDGKYFILSSGDWPLLCRLLELPPAVANDERFFTNRGRVDNREELTPIFEAATRCKTRDEWLRALAGAGLYGAPVLDYEELFSHPQVAANEMIVDVPHPAGPYKMPGIPVKFTATPGAVRSGPPAVGQHTEEVMLELGYTWDQIRDLSARHVVGFVSADEGGVRLKT